MHGYLSDEQLFLQETVRAVSRRLDAESGWETLQSSAYTEICDKGSGCSALDVAVIVESIAERLCPSPFLGSAVLGASLLALAGAHDVTQPVAVAFDEQLRDLLVADSSDGVAWDCPAEAIVLALGADGRTVVAGVAGELVAPGLDLERPCRTTGSVWHPVGELDSSGRDRWLAGALIALSAELCGMMAGCLGSALAFSKERRQFGRPIGSFQAIQHLLAARYVDVESARSAVYAAADALDSDGSDAGLAMARVAKAHASARSIEVIEASLQVHGGIGMAWEFLGHRYLRRAWLDTVTLGGPTHHHKVIAASLLHGAPGGGTHGRV